VRCPALLFEIMNLMFFTMAYRTPSSTNQGRHVFEIHLLQFSTGKPHPLAKSPVIRVSESPWPFPSLGMEIVGNHLALILTHHTIRSQPDDSFYIFDWKAGTLNMVSYRKNCNLQFVFFATVNSLGVSTGRERSVPHI